MLIAFKPITFLILISFLFGCSSSGLRTDLSEDELPSCGSAQHSVAETAVTPERKKSTLMIHPGLMMGIDWGGERALTVGRMLVKEGYAADLLEVRSRQKEPMYLQMLDDGGGEFVGVHYSMGGSPSVLQAALDAAEDVTLQTGQLTAYTAIMVDPFALAQLDTLVDPANPYLKHVYIVLSNRFMPFRPDPSGLSASTMQHTKFTFVFAEEFGVHWNHFSFLTDVKSDEQDDQDTLRGKAIFAQILQGAFGQVDHQAVKKSLERLKHQYAKEDQRTVIPGQCRLVL